MKSYREHFKDEHLPLLRHHILFSGLTDHEIFMFIQYSKPLYLHLKENRSKRITEKHTHMIGIVFSGNTHVYNIDSDGNKTLLKEVNKNETSGTLYAMLDYYNSLIELCATEDSDVLFIPPEALFITDDKLASIQHKILTNMLATQRQIFLEITAHLTCLSKRSIKEKVLRFLKNYCQSKHSYSFSVPFSREELANYLAVDRASLSRTLGELKNEGIIDFRKNHFTILKTDGFNF